MKTCYFENSWFENTINNDGIHLVGNFDVHSIETTCSKIWCLSAYPKPTSSQTSFWDIVRTLQTCYFGNFRNAWPSPYKIIISISIVSALKKSKFITHFFFWICCKEIANLLFWVIWASLATNTLNDGINLKKPLFICRQKINFFLQVSLEILTR